MKNTIWLSLFLLMESTVVFSQAPTQQDCMGAIPICNNSYISSHVYLGSGSVNSEINPNISCLKDDSYSTWYTFTAQSSGLLRFSINPINTSDDYDWALFDLTNAECSDIFNNPLLAVSCNSFQNLLGVDGQTGARSANGGTNSLNGPGTSNGPPWNADIPVTIGSTYMLIVANMSHSGYGYSIDFNGSTGQIYDNISPTIRPIATADCADSVVEIQFSEYVLNNSVQSSDFEIIGSSGNIPIDSIYSRGYASRSSHDRGFSIKTRLPLQKGSYTLVFIGTVEDLCGNTSVGDTLAFEVQGLNIQTSSTPVTCNDNGTATCTVLNGQPPYAYLWDNGDTHSSIRGLSAKTYRVIASDHRGCSDSAFVTVMGNESLKVRLDKTDVACNGDFTGAIKAHVSLGYPPYMYQWSNGQQDAEVKKLAVGIYSLTVTDFHGCTVKDSVEIGQSAKLSLQLDSVVTETCSYADGAIYTIADGGVSPYQYSWSLLDAPNSPNLVGVHAGTYYLKLVDALQCEINLSVDVPGGSAPIADFLILPPNAFLSQANIVFENQSINHISSSWSFGDGSFSMENSPSHSYSNVGNFTVMLIVQSANLCIDTLEKNISILEDFFFYMPNAFTPNGDYRNECLKPSIFGKRETNYSFEVYSRWGDLIFKTNDIEKCWDGDISIELPTSETKYLYHIKVFDLCNNLHEFLGSFVMMR